jgi:trk system potassium uptake protein TrkH
MRIKAILHYLGLLIAALGLFMLLPLVISLIYGEPDTLAFTSSMVISIVFGLALWRLTPLNGKGLSQREAILLVVAGYISATIFGALPYIFAGVFPTLLDAFFESLSGYTTTGATVLNLIESQSHGILIWRSLTQWLGGMGIIMFFVALFPILGIGAAHLVEAETPGGHHGERLTARIRDTVRAMWVVYLGLSVAEIILLLIARLPFFDALTVTLSTIPIGGFTPTDLSIGAYNSLFVEGIVIFFMIACGVNFGLYYFLFWKRQPGRLLANPEFRLYLLFLVGAIVLINLDLIVNMGMSIGEAFRYGTFNTTSILTTTGFATTDFASWPPFARSLLLVLMVVGASAGSTGGALKVVRILVLAKYAYRRIIHAFNPRAVIPLKVGGTVLAEEIISRVISLTILYFAILWAGFLIMSALGLELETALSSVTASIGNVGPGLGMVGPEANYLFIPPLGKVTLMVLMLAGRLELFALLVLFVPAFWRWR